MLFRACRIIENGSDFVHTCLFVPRVGAASVIGKEVRIKYTFKLHGVGRCVIAVQVARVLRFGDAGGRGHCLKISDQVTVLQGPRIHLFVTTQRLQDPLRS